MSDSVGLSRADLRACVKQLSNNIRAENIDYTSYLDLYSGEENIENIDNKNNTVIYGRRGSGKTHLLRALHERLQLKFESSRNFPVYVDLRRIIPLLSSDQDQSDVDAILTFKYLLQEIAHVISENMHLVLGVGQFDPAAAPVLNGRKSKLMASLERLYLHFDGQTFKKPGSLAVQEEELRSLNGGIKISQSPALDASATLQSGKKVETHEHKYISILEISNEIDNLIQAGELERITVLLDEWSEISIPTQLYLAELLKKSFSAISVTLKIAAIPNRTNLGVKTDKKFVGLEDGGDISSYPLDMRYVFEVNRTQTRDFFNDLLYRHLTAIDSKCISRFLEGHKLGKEKLINTFFANVALNEILVASAGIPRDFMNLFINSYDRYLLTSTSSARRISVKNLRSANAEWYETDKKEQVDKHPIEKQLLGAIVSEVVGNKKSMHFLIPEKYAQNKHIQNLIDFRVMHLRRSGYSHKDHAGASYNVYSIDYGCFNSMNVLKGNLNSTHLDNLHLKDLRDVRRISLGDAFFNSFLMSVGDAFPCPHCNRAVDTSHLAFVKQGLCNNCFERVPEPD